MNEKYEKALLRTNPLAWSMYKDMKSNERLIVEWKKFEKQNGSGFWSGMVRGYIDANKKLKSNIIYFGLRRAI